MHTKFGLLFHDRSSRKQLAERLRVKIRSVPALFSHQAQRHGFAERGRMEKNLLLAALRIRDSQRKRRDDLPGTLALLVPLVHCAAVIAVLVENMPPVGRVLTERLHNEVSHLGACAERVRV